MNEAPLVTVDSIEPTVKPIALECKFTVEAADSSGGDYLKNIGGGRTEKRITFDGYANPELLEVLAQAMIKVVSDERC